METLKELAKTGAAVIAFGALLYWRLKDRPEFREKDLGDGGIQKLGLNEHDNTKNL
jgi:hypothetical protein